MSELTNWKQAHANEAEAMAQHEMVERVLDEFAFNMRFERKGLPAYGLAKIVSIVAQVVLARAHGIEPETLRLSRDEVSAQQMQLIQRFAEQGKPVVLLVTDGAQVVTAHVYPGSDFPTEGEA